MGNFKGIIFDFFGTLSEQNCAPEDTIVEHFKLYQRQGFDYEFVEDVVCGTACPTPFGDNERYEYYQTLIEKLRLPKNRHGKLFNLLRVDIARDKMIEGTIEIVDFARSRCEKLGMISDLPNPDYDFSTKWGFADRFDFRHMSYDPEWVNSGSYSRVLKPDPLVFHRTLEKLGTYLDNTVMIGNSMHSDIKPARVLGMRAILVDYHNKHPDDPDRITSLEELRSIL